jgi:putative transposase
VQHQIILGGADFVKKMRAMMSIEAKVKPKPIRPSLKKLFSRVKDKPGRNAAIRVANREHRYSLNEIGQFVGLHISTISKIANSEDS